MAGSFSGAAMSPKKKRDSLRGDITNTVRGQMGDFNTPDAITAARMAQYEADTNDARDAHIARLKRFGVLRGSGNTADVLGKFEGQAQRGGLDIQAQGISRRLANLDRAIGFETSEANRDESARQFNSNDLFRGQQLTENMRQFDQGQALTREQAAAERQHAGALQQWELAQRDRALAESGRQYDAGITSRESEASLDRQHQRDVIGDNFANTQKLQTDAQQHQERQLGSQLGFNREQLIAQTGQQALDRGSRESMLASQLSHDATQATANRGLQRFLQNDAQMYQAGQAGLDRGQQLTLQQRENAALLARQRDSQGFQGGQNTLDRQQQTKAIQEQFIGQGNLQREQNLFAGREGAANRQIDRERLASAERMQDDQQGFLGTQANMDRGLTREQMTDVRTQAALDREQQLTVQERQNQFAAGENALARNEQSRQFDASLGQADRQFTDQSTLARDAFEADNRAREIQQFGGTEGFSAKSVGVDPMLLQRGARGELTNPQDRAAFMAAADQLVNGAQRELGRDLTEGERQILFNGGHIGQRDTLAARQLAQQAEQFDSGQQHQLALQRGDQTFQGVQNAAQRTLAREQMAQQGEQFATEQGRLSAAQRDSTRLAEAGLTGQIQQGANRPPTQTLAAKQLAQQESQFQDSLGEQRNTRLQQAGQFTSQLNQNRFDNAANRRLEQQRIDNQAGQFSSEQTRLKTEAQYNRELQNNLARGSVIDPVTGRRVSTLEAQQLAQQDAQFRDDLGLRREGLDEQKHQYDQESAYRTSRDARQDPRDDLAVAIAARESGVKGIDNHINRGLESTLGANIDPVQAEQLSQEMQAGEDVAALESKLARTRGRNGERGLSDEQRVLKAKLEATKERQTAVGNGENRNIENVIADDPEGFSKDMLDSMNTALLNSPHISEEVKTQIRAAQGGVAGAKSVAQNAASRTVESIGRSREINIQDLQKTDWPTLAAAINSMPGNQDVRGVGQALKFLQSGKNVDMAIKMLTGQGYKVRR